MRLFRTLAVTFAQYSRIPMPRFEWKEEDMRCSMAAFPLVGAVIGLLYCAVYWCCVHFTLPDAASALLLTAVPLIVTGGFHVDGFMDVSDALSSFRTREEKLEILKDPHIGAFAVIRLAVTGLIYIAAMIIVIASEKATAVMYTIALGFVLSRALSAQAVLNFRSARNEGMLYYEATSAAGGRTINQVFTAIWIAAAAGFMVFFESRAGIFEIAAALLSFAWYKYKSYKEFGGITGDTAGWFVVICETAMAAAAAAAVLVK